MKGEVAGHTPTGCPYPTPVEREFSRDDVVAFGKIVSEPHEVPRDEVAEDAGVVLFVRAGQQPWEDERWLRREARLIVGAFNVSRDNHFSVKWRHTPVSAAPHDVSSQDSAPSDIPATSGSGSSGTPEA